MNDSLLKVLPALLTCLACIPPASALDVKRLEVKAFIDETSRNFGFPREQLESLLAQAETKQAILDAISRPAERVVPWYEYRERFLTEKRILQGTDFWIEHAAHDLLGVIRADRIVGDVYAAIAGELHHLRLDRIARVIERGIRTMGSSSPPPPTLIAIANLPLELSTDCQLDRAR